MTIKVTTGPCPTCCGKRNCSLECQSQTALAALCGFDPFTGADGRKFRKKTKAGTMYQGQFSSGSCNEGSSFLFSGGPIQWIFTGAGVTWTITVTPTTLQKISSTIFYQHFSVTKVTSPPNSGPGGSIPFGIWYPGYTGTNYLRGALNCTSNDGTADDFLAIGITDASWLALVAAGGGVMGQQGNNFVGNYTSPGNNGCTGTINIMIGGTGALESIRYIWDKTSEYTPSGSNCGSPAVVDNSNEHDQAFAPFPLTVGGQSTGGVVDPPDALINRITIDTSVTIDGTNVCTNIGGSYYRAQGETIESLTEEDTGADALARAAFSDWGGGGCVSSIQQRNPGDTTFGVIKARVKATFTGLTIGQNYEGFINFQYRPAGSSQDWQTYGQQSVTFTAEGTSETTDWVDVPLVDGQEIKPSSCYVVPL